MSSITEILKELNALQQVNGYMNCDTSQNRIVLFYSVLKRSKLLGHAPSWMNSLHYAK